MRTIGQFVGVWFLVAASFTQAQIGGDVLGAHDLSFGGTSMVKGPSSSACLYCHAPHGGSSSPPLWNQQLSIQTYEMYTSSTYHQTGVQPLVGSSSKMCLSCHDGTVAPGQTIAYGQLTMGAGTMKPTTKFGADLKSSHPFSLQAPLVNAPGLTSLLFTGTPPRTTDPEVQLVNGNIECTTCHQPHSMNIDRLVQKFLVRNSANGALCLACHDPGRVVLGQTNFLAGWTTSIHAIAAHTTPNQPYVGGYGSVAENACSACHMPHNASGPARLLRGPDEKACLTCHSGSNTQPALLNIAGEFAKPKVGHPFAPGTNTHDPLEPVLLNNNRHATCVDCHNPHASLQTTAFGAAPRIRQSQNAATGISASDGLTGVNPAVDQYQVCLRCHGTSAGKVADMVFGYLPLREVSGSDPLNVIAQFSALATSSHPVTHSRSSPLAQPSLRLQMVNLDGTTPGRAMGTQIFCTDCHNSDDNREFGGGGPNGPHGSKWTHILERRYEISQAPVPGAGISNPFPTPDLTVAGPYALCSKCHDLTQVLSAASPFPEHVKHVVEKGASCSVCHTAHGMGGININVSGERLVNFDVNVVGPVGAQLSRFNRPTKSCTLSCHGKQHDNATY